MENHEPRHMTDKEAIELANEAYTDYSYSDIESVSSDGGYPRVIEVRDHDGPNESGFYACVVQLDENTSTICYRGSNDNFDKILSGKDGTTVESFIREWGGANLGLLNSTGGLEQQREAAEFTVEMMRKYPDMDFSMTGHSLGGQLSFYSAIYIAENYPEFRDRIVDSFNLDGPGFSEEFLNDPKHAEAIQWLIDNGKLTHYQWSFVGELLNSPVGDQKRTLKVQGDGTDEEKTGIKRHSPVTGVLDPETGTISDGEMDDVSKALGPISRRIDHYSSSTNVPLALLQYLVSSPEGPKIVMAGGLIIGGAITFLAAHPLIATIVSSIVVVSLVAVGLVVLGKFISDVWKKLTEKKLDGDYSVNYAELSAVSAILDDAAKEIKRIADKVEETLSTIQYESAAGCVAKNAIRGAGYKIAEASGKVNYVKDNLNTVIGYYRNGDHEAGDKYYKYATSGN